MTSLWLLRQGTSRPERKDEPSEDLADKVAERRWFCCRICRAPIADAAARLDWAGKPLIFANPEGVVYELVTVREAAGVHVLGAPTTDATWFSGYAWQVVLCRKCLNHLGWNYSAASAGVTPPTFFGLIRAELVESGEDESF